MLILNDQAAKFESLTDERTDELDEDSLLESPLDKVEPYSMFKSVFLGMLTFPNNLWESETGDFNA